MIYIFTGLPGNFKTCSAIEYIDKRFVQEEKRQVYAYNIKGLRTDLLPGWHVVETLEEFKEWWKFPKGAVLVGDEAQEYLPQRSKDRPPEWIERLAMHRHTDKFGENSGAYDFVFISQDVMFIDVFVRRLCNDFRHNVRPVGLSYANVSVYPKVVNPEDYHDKQLAVKNYRYKPDKKYYGVYTSADTHTIKVQMPWKKLGGLAALLGLVIGCGVVLYNMKDKFNGKPETKTVGNSSPAKSGSNPFTGGMGGVSPSDRLDTSSLASYVPRVAGLPHTAPRYDEVTKPTTAPVPVACVAKKNECVCFTQQGTRMHVDEGQCRVIVAHGYFMDFDPDQNKRSSGGVEARLRENPVQPIPAAPAASPAAPVTVNVAAAGPAMPGSGGEAVGKRHAVSEMNLRPYDNVREPKY